MHESHQNHSAHRVVLGPGRGRKAHPVRAGRLAIQIVSLIAALIVPLGFAAPSALGRTPAPVLGSKSAFPTGTGFGTVKPRTVYLGGDPTGQVESITWRQWGSGRTVGFGQGWCPGSSVASGYPCQAALHVYGLGRCHGRRAYQTLAFYFKPGSAWIAGAKLNICSGQYQF
jgi:hypothetical protein